MHDILLLRLDAPLMSFGAPIVDNYGVIQAFPGRSQLTGLIANALGYHHRNTAQLQRLQNRIHFAARCDRPGIRIMDYQTVDLGQEFMRDDNAWTTRDKPDRKGDSKNSAGTHIRYRYYWADSIFTVAVCLDPDNESPNIETIASAVINPARPLFIGRKCCLPASPLFLTMISASSLIDSLSVLPRIPDKRTGMAPNSLLSVWWDDDPKASKSSYRTIPVTDERDWSNQVHTGRRFIYQGLINPPEAPDDNRKP